MRHSAFITEKNWRRSLDVKRLEPKTSISRQDFWESNRKISTDRRLKYRGKQTWILWYKICKTKVTSGFCAHFYPVMKPLYHKTGSKKGKVITKVEFRIQNMKVTFKMWNSLTKWESRLTFDLNLSGMPYFLRILPLLVLFLPNMEMELCFWYDVWYNR